MKISAMIVVTLAAIVAVIPASATNDETFGQVSNLDDVAAVASSPNLRALAGIAGTSCSNFLGRDCKNGVGYICLRKSNGKLAWKQSGVCPK